MNIPSLKSKSIKIVYDHDKCNPFHPVFFCFKRGNMFFTFPASFYCCYCFFGWKFACLEMENKVTTAVSFHIIYVLYMAVYIFLSFEKCPFILFSTLVSLANTEAGQMGAGRIRFHLCMWAISTLALTKVSKDYKPSEIDKRYTHVMHWN